MQDVLAHEYLVGDAHHFILAFLVEDDDVVDVGAVAHKLVFLQSGAYEAVVAVDIQLLVGLDDLCSLDGVEVLYLGQSGMCGSVFLLQISEPVSRNLNHVVQLMVYVVHFGLYLGYQLLGLVLVELQYACHLDVHEAQDVVLCNLAYHLRIERRQPVVDVLACCVHVGSLLKLAVFVDALLDEYLFERREVELLEQLMLAYLELLAQQGHGAVGRVAQHVVHGQELRLVVFDYAAVGRDVYLAVGEGVEGVDGLV